MLGYQTSFVQMTCVNLLCSQKYTEKRVAYIALCLLLDERSEVLLLTANTIKKDLESSNQFNISIALNAIGEACTADMCRQLSSEVVKLMNNPNPFIKKKAALAATKIIKKCPDLTETFLERLGNYLDDKNHGVLLCGVTLAIQIFKHDLNFVDKHRKYMYGIVNFNNNSQNT
jgi:AP-1 complex subunit gamma-1